MNIDVDFKALTLCGGNAFLLMIPQRGFKLPNWETGCSTDAVWDWISGGSKGMCIYILIVVIFLGYLLIHAPRILGFRILGLRILSPRTKDPQS